MSVKKMLFGLGGIAVLAAPMLAVVSCGNATTSDAPKRTEFTKDGITINQQGIVIRFEKTDPNQTDLILWDFVETKEYGNIYMKGINEGVFKNQSLTSLTIEADHLEWIGANAFEGNQISEIKLPTSLQRIEDGAFKNNVIRSIAYKDKVAESVEGEFAEEIITKATEYDLTKIGNEAFYGNEIESLTLLNNKSTPTSIGNSAFENNKISSLSLGDTISTIGDYAFKGNRISGRVNFGKEIISIGTEAFQKNYISELVLGNSKIESIGNSAFEGNLITNLIVPATITTIRYEAFANNSINQLTLNTGIEKISAGAFKNNKIVALSIPTTVKTIGEAAFMNNEITQLTFNRGETESLKMIGDQAFYNNKIHTDIDLPYSVMYIGEEAFLKNEIKNVTVADNTAIEQNAFELSVAILKNVVTIPELK